MDLISILSCALGFGNSMLPHIVKYFIDKNKNATDMKILDIKYKYSLKEKEIAHEISKLNHMYAYDNLNTNSSAIELLRATVRPVITYLFLIMLLALKFTTLFYLLNSNNKTINIIKEINGIWDRSTSILFLSIISFWFGDRSIKKIMHAQ